MPDKPLAETEIDDTRSGEDDLLDVHDRAMKRFDSVAPSQIEIRAESLSARRFVTIAGAMWESGWAESWPENAPRPEIDKITNSLEKIETDYRENRLMVNFVPSGDDGVETADTLNGMYMADAAHFKASQSRDNAFQEGIRGGMGAWRVATDYSDPYDPEDESQRINPGIAIVDADQSVYFDGASKLYDKSDAKWCFVISAQTRISFNEQWGEENADPWPIQKWNWVWDWYMPDVVQVAEYYEKEETSDKLLIFTQQQSGEEQRYFESEIESGVAGDLKAQGWTKRTRPIKRMRVHKYIINGSKILKDCGYIAGPNIPIVPFYGRRDYCDNMERWRGHVLKRMDDQRNLNSQIGRLIEISSLSPFEVPVFAPEQMPPQVSEQWARANIDRLPYLLAEPVRKPDDGTPIQMGAIDRVKPPEVPAVTAALLQFTMASLTDQDDNADQVKANTSADAMDIAAARVDAKSQIYLDNFRQSEQRAGEIYLGMAREVYYEPGRKVETLTIDGQDGTAELHEPIRDKNGVYRVRNDLSQAKFKVIADVQESTATKRQKTVRQALELATAFGSAGATQDATAALYLAGMNMDGTGIQDFQDYLRQKAIAAGSVKPTPEEQQELQQAEQNKQPDPNEIALETDIAEKQSKTDLNKAKTAATLSKAHLEDAQANSLEQAPRPPTGLAPAPETPNPVDQVETLASAKLKDAQANKINEDSRHQRIRTGAELNQQAHDQDMERRQQALAERQQDHIEAQPTAGQ